MSINWISALLHLFSFLSLNCNLVDGSATLRLRMIGGDHYHGSKDTTCDESRRHGHHVKSCSLLFHLFVKRNMTTPLLAGTFKASLRTAYRRSFVKFINNRQTTILRFETWTTVVHFEIHSTEIIATEPPLYVKWQYAKKMTIEAGANEARHNVSVNIDHYTAMWSAFLAVLVTCDPHFFGPDCAKFCRPQKGPSGHYTCDSTGAKRCRPNWSREVSNCTVPDPCRPNRCRNKAACVVTPKGSDFYCQCPPDYRGHLCEIAKGPCERAEPCRNGGQCLNVSGQAKCWCPSEFGGLHCEAIGNAKEQYSNRSCDTCIKNVCIAVAVTLVLVASGRLLCVYFKPGIIHCWRKQLNSRSTGDEAYHGSVVTLESSVVPCLVLTDG